MAMTHAWPMRQQQKITWGLSNMIARRFHAAHMLNGMDPASIGVVDHFCISVRRNKLSDNDLNYDLNRLRPTPNTYF